MNAITNSPNSITILGSGTCVPSLQRSSCSVLVKIRNHNVLIDAGPGTIRRLLHAGTSVFDITYLFLSHFHPDHTSELVPFLFANKYPDGSQRKKNLTIIAGKGFKDFFYRLKKLYGEWITLPNSLFQILELNISGPDQLQFEDFQINSIPVNHRPESVAIRITLPEGKTIVYSGDTDYSTNLIEISKDATYLICECAMPDGEKIEGHLTPSLAGKIAAEARVSNLILTHFYPPCEKVDIEKQCRKAYKGPLMAARDLMVFDL